MVVNLLIKVQVLGRPLSFSRITCIEDCLTIRGPGRASPASRELDMLDYVRQLFAGFDLEKTEIAIFSPVLRQRNGDDFAIRRRNKPVGRGGARSIDRVWITNDLL